MWIAIFLIFVVMAGLILIGLFNALCARDDSEKIGDELEFGDEDDDEYAEMAFLIILINEGIL